MGTALTNENGGLQYRLIHLGCLFESESTFVDSGVMCHFASNEEKMKKIQAVFVILIVMGFAGGFLSAGSVEKEPTKASQSPYNKNYRLATTSEDLSKADLAWHAKNTYGWDCEEVVSKKEIDSSGNLLIECANGEKFRVRLRPGRHPIITNKYGTYK